MILDASNWLIVGLGNPGVKYEKTRHNLGFEVVIAFAKAHGWVFRRGFFVNGKIAAGSYEGKKLFLLMPITYMNLSGEAVVEAMRVYKVPIEQLLVVVDDVYVKYGNFRLRDKGSAGGHNGLKSIERVLRTQNYTRLRVGIGPKDEKNIPDGRSVFLEDYVLSKLTLEEQNFLTEVTDNGVKYIEQWLVGANTGKQ